jgi:hypothetical protein
MLSSQIPDELKLVAQPVGIRFHWGEFLLTFRLFFIHLLLLSHIFPAWLILSSRLPWPSRTASMVTVYAVDDQE